MSIETEQKIRTVEQTSKRFKMMILIAWALIIAGVSGIFTTVQDVQSGAAATPEDVSLWPTLTIMGGFVTWVYAKFMIWWHHS